jgi:hypothetical protein
MANTKMEKPLVDAEYVLEKIPGKGGWTYVVINEIAPDKRSKFGWVKVRGSVEDFQLNQYKLMPMGNGKLFLPVRAEIRKKIKKQEGDKVRVILYLDERPLGIPEEIMECFKNEPEAVFQNFSAFTEGEQKAYLDWIYEAKKEDTKAERIVKMMDRLLENKRLHEL